MIQTDIAVLGGGASSMFLLANLKTNQKVVVIDKNIKLGKKILVTGNGRCNLTNKNLNKNFYNDEKVMNFIQKFNEKQTISVFSNLGLETYSDEEGRIYPLSNSASSVVEVLQLAINNNKNIDCMLETNIEKVERQNNKFLISTDKGQILAEKIIFALGSKNGENFFDSLGIEYKNYIPSLCALKTNKNKYVSGVRVDNTKVFLKVKEKIYSEIGEVLFKEDGISGIVIFNLSRFLSYENNFNANLNLDLLTCYNYEELKEKLFIRKSKLNSFVMENFFAGMLNINLAKNIIDKAGLKFDMPVKYLTEKDIINLVELIKNYSLKVCGHFDNNQVFSGGVDLKNLTQNLSYKNSDNIFFLGEAINVDGACGGYNLQWAWTSAKIVSDHLNT